VSRGAPIASALLALAATWGVEPLAGTPVPADPPAANDAFAPFLAAVRGGVAASWIEPPAQGSGASGSSRIRFARFDGTGWSPPVTVAESAALFANWADTPGLVEGGDGALVAWWLEKLGAGTYAYGIRLARSIDSGATWRALGWLQDDDSETEHGFVSGVAEGAAARLFWLDGRATTAAGAMGLRTTTVGESVAASALVDDAVCDCCATAAASGAGGATVVYRDRTTKEIRDIRLARPAGASWQQSPVAIDGWRIAGCPVNGPAVVASQERLVVAWYSGADDRGRVAVSVSRDGGSTFSAKHEVDERSPLGRVALARLGVGQAALAWLGRAGEGAEVRLARVAEDGAVAPPLVLGTTGGGRQSGVPRLAALEENRLLALWTEAGEGPTRLRGALVSATELPAL
jgi:hypothetical protein